MTIPSQVETIGRKAFYDCETLTTVTIPNGVTKIAEEAFRSCTRLESVYLPAGSALRTLGANAFAGCIRLAGIALPQGVVEIGAEAFYYCRQIRSLEIPTSTTTIGDRAFAGCSSLGSMIVPNSVTNIGEGAFRECSGLVTLGLSNSIAVIKDSTLMGCTRLTTIEIPSAVTKIGEYALADCHQLTGLNVPTTVRSIGAEAFRGINALRYCGAAEGSPWGAGHVGCDIVVDGDFIYADASKSRLIGYCGLGQDVVIPTTVTTIGHSAFSNTTITAVYISNSVTTIESQAFAKCTRLIRVALSDSLTSIGDSAFFGCKALNTPVFPQSITKIGAYAFAGCQRFETLVLPPRLTTLSEGVFAACYYLTDVTLPESLATIGARAFLSCVNLSRLTLPASVTTIGELTFGYCHNLSNISIPSTVTTIGEEAFEAINIVGYCGEASGRPWGAGHVGCEVVRDGDFIYTDSSKTHLIGYCGDGGDIAIAPTVTTIASYTFYKTEEHLRYLQGILGSEEYYPTITNLSRTAPVTSITFPPTLTTLERYSIPNVSSLQVLVFATPRPPETRLDNFSPVTGLTLYVPCNAAERYRQTAPWDNSRLTYIEYYTGHDTLAQREELTAETACDSFGWRGWHITTSGTYHDTVKNAIQCKSDSVFRLELRIVHDIAATVSERVPADSTYRWHGVAYPTAGTYHDTVRLAVEGVCDSLYTLELSYYTPPHPQPTDPQETGIDRAEAAGVTLQTQGTSITVGGAQGQTVRLYDSNGRPLATASPAGERQTFVVGKSGTYLVQVGRYAAQRVVVVR